MIKIKHDGEGKIIAGKMTKAGVWSGVSRNITDEAVRAALEVLCITLDSEHEHVFISQVNLDNLPLTLKLSETRISRLTRL